MTVDPAMLDLMREYVSHAACTGQDSFGAESYGTAVNRQCRIERRPRIVRRSDGTEIVASATIYLADAPGVGLRDRMTLPDGTTSPIVTISRYRDEYGQAFEVVTLA